MTGPIDSTSAAYLALTEHRFYAYRGCAPDADDPTRMAGNPDLPVGAHHAPDVDGGEEQAARRAREDAAVEVCLSCPVMVACDAYASSVTAEGRLAEPDGVAGGRRALERHRVFIRTRHEVSVQAPDTRFNTLQKQAVLRAFAGCWEPYEVAAAAEVELRRLTRAAGRSDAGCRLDVRTANWQRSNMATLLGVPHDGTRAQFLAAAVGRGLLDGVAVVADDGTVPAVPPPTKTVVTEIGGQFLLWPAERAELQHSFARPVGVRRPRRVSLRVWFADVSGQLDLLLADLDADLADVHSLFTATPLEAAA